jgi:outer membrane protein
MKKLKVLAVAFSLLVTGGSMAQVKIAYLDAETLLYMMPETAKADSIVQQYRVDTIQPEYTSLLTNYKFQDSIYRDTQNVPKAVRDQAAKQLPSYIYQIQNWDQIVQQAVEAKQNELLGPVYKRLNDAINAVAKEKGYTFVLSRNAVLVAPDADNIIALVAKKLNLTLPDYLLPGYKPPAGGTKPAGN